MNDETWIDDHGIKRGISDVFVSYSHEDEELILRICTLLAEEGLEVFSDRVMEPGVDYVSFLRTALDYSRLVLVCWSAHSASSEWVLAEAEYARTRKRLVSCKIRPCMLGPPFNTFHTVNLSDWSGDPEERIWKQVPDLIKRRVRGDANDPIRTIVVE